MSFPVCTETYELTDFIIEEESTAIQTQFFFYPRDKELEAKYTEKEYKILLYRGLTLGDDNYSICTINIPPFCQGKAKLGVFLKDFSTLLNEMLVKWDRETVERLFTEAMQKIFPEDAADYELGFYEKYGFLYCTVQFSEEGHKKAFGQGWLGTSTAKEMSYVFMPPKRLRFQETDPARKEVENQIKAKALRRKRHPRRTCSLKDYIEMFDSSAEKSSSEENKTEE